MTSKLLPLLSSLAACGGGTVDNSDLPAFEEQLSSDVDQLARTTQDAANATFGLDEAGAQQQVCVDWLGDCRTCLNLDGRPLQGTITGDLEAACGASITGRAGGTYTWSVLTNHLEGTWTGSSSGVRVQLTGSRSATLDLEPARGPARQLQAALELSALQMIVSPEGALTSWSATLSYTGFGGHDYDVSISGQGDALSGTATSGTVTCEVSGTTAAPQVSCTDASGA